MNTTHVILDHADGMAHECIHCADCGHLFEPDLDRHGNPEFDTCDRCWQIERRCRERDYQRAAFTPPAR